MTNILKELAVLLFSAGEELEKKAGEYKQTRETRQEEFVEKMQKQKEEMKEKYQSDMDCLKEKFAETAGKAGFATRDEISEIKAMVKELSDKIDSLTK